MAGGEILITSHFTQDEVDQALCTKESPQLFFPERGQGGGAGNLLVREAKKVCAKCPIRERCLDLALENHEAYGVWGGTSERERRVLNRR